MLPRPTAMATGIVHERKCGEMAKHLKLSLKRFHALEVTRIAVGNQKLVYALIANKKYRYPHGKSGVSYIGTTKKGIKRVASSAAYHAEEILGEYGVKKIVARIITCKPRSNVKTWVKLERAMLLMFRSQYGAVPEYNRQGHKIRETDEFSYFSREAVRKMVLELG
jgi:hypothetical protein